MKRSEGMRAFAALLVLSLTGCLGSAVSAVPGEMLVVPPPEEQTAPLGRSGDEDKALLRQEALQRRAMDAVLLDGHPGGVEIVHAVVECKRSLKACLDLSVELESESRAAVMAGWAIRTADMDIGAAEKFVDLAERAAAH